MVPGTTFRRVSRPAENSAGFQTCDFELDSPVETPVLRRRPGLPELRFGVGGCFPSGMNPVVFVAMLLAAVIAPGARAAELRPVVEVEETVYSHTNANNGAGPMWCHGSTCLARVGDRLFATGLETIPGVAPLNNCRWFLLERDGGGWIRRFTDTDGRTREPSPIAAFSDGTVWVSTNPTLAPNRTEPGGGPARPEIVQFAASAASRPAATLQPAWDGSPAFTEHSYRSLAADGASGALVLFQNVGDTHAEWTFRDGTGRWSAQGRLRWPWGADYEVPQPIRVCYPNVAVRGREVHFFGVSDIQEPRRAWREFKHTLTGRHWDYDFRRLFHTWTPDITREPFRAWTEIASRESTGGGTAVCDLFLAPDGAVHLLWTERAIDERLRATFFPDARQSHALHHAVLRDGRVIRRQTLQESTEDKPGIIASAGRFQSTPDHRLFVIFYAGGTGTDGRPVAENCVLELLSDGTATTPVRVPLIHPLTAYFTATPRAGSPPSRTLEMLGTAGDSPSTLRFARVRLD